MDIVLAITSILLAAVIGFAVHRASLCNVKAVAELLSTRRAYMLGSFLKTVLWVIAITFLSEKLFQPAPTQHLQLRNSPLFALAGGFTFGVGAAFNGGCALGTLGRLGNGDLRMLLTLLGMVVGLAGAGYAEARTRLPSPQAVDVTGSMPHVLAIAIPAILSLFALWELGPARAGGRVLALLRCPRRWRAALEPDKG